MKSDADLIFEMYIGKQKPILESSIVDYDSTSLSDLYKWDLDCIDTIVSEGFADIASNIGSHVKNIASNIGSSIWKKFAFALVSQLPKEEQSKLEKILHHAESDGMTPEASKIAKELDKETVVQDSFNNHLYLFDTFLTENTVSMLMEAAKKAPYVPLAKRAKVEKDENSVPTIKATRAKKAPSTTAATKTKAAPAASTAPSPATVTKTPSELKNIRKAILAYLATKKTDKQKANAYQKLDQSIRKTFDQNVTSLLNAASTPVNNNTVASASASPVAPNVIDIPKTENPNKAKDMDVINHIADVLSTVKGDKSKALSDFILSVKSEFKNDKGMNSFQMPRTTYIDPGDGNKIERNPESVVLPPELEKIKKDVVSYVSSYKPEMADKIKFFTKAGLMLSKLFPVTVNRPDPVININGVLYPNPQNKNTPQEAPSEEQLPTEQKGLISRVYKWLKDHPKLTAASIMGLVGAITAATGGSVALVPLLKAALAGGATGAGIEAGKQAINNKSLKGMDWGKIGSAGLKGATVGTLAKGISNIADTNNSADYSNDSEYLNNSNDDSTETSTPVNEPDNAEDIVKAEPVSHDDVVKAEPVTGTSPSEFKKLTGTEFDPNSIKDKKISELIRDLKSKHRMDLFDKLSDQINQKYGAKSASYVNSLKW